MKVTTDAPDVATIIICGPVGCGKTSVAFRLQEILEREFSARVVLNDDLIAARNAGEDITPQWMRKSIKETVWLLCEETK